MPAALFAAMLCGCGEKPKSKSTQPDEPEVEAAAPVEVAPATAPAQPRNDADILADLKEAYGRRSEPAESDIRYYVKDRKVTITGWVPTRRHVDNLKTAAKAVSGVEAVLTASVHVDEDLAAAVHKALDRFRAGMLADRFVQVRLGEATIDGRGTIGGVRKQAGKLVAAVPGVRKIDNRINDDNAINDAIGKALNAHDGLGEYDGQWRWSVTNGVVTLEGWINKSKGRDLLKQICKRLPGVRTVDVSKIEIRPGD